MGGTGKRHSQYIDSNVCTQAPRVEAPTERARTRKKPHTHLPHCMAGVRPQLSAVPEPSGLVLFAIAALTIVVVRRTSNRSQVLAA